MKKLLLFAVIALIALSFSGCNEATTASADTTTQQEHRTLVISSSFVREVYEKEEYQDYIFDAFEEAHNCTIQLDVYSETGALFDKIKTEQESNNIVTDLLIAHYSDMVNYIDGNDYVLDLSNLETEMSDRTFSDAFNSSTNRGDSRYFFPINTDLYLSIANVDAFNYLPSGLTEEDVLAGNYTWTDFVNWVDGDHVKTAILGQAAKMIIYQIGGMALSHTDTIEGTFPGLNTDANKRAWSDILEMYLKGGIHPESANIADLSGLLQNGSIQLAFTHMNQVSTVYTNAPAQFKVFPGPKGESGKAGTIIGGHGIGIIKGSDNEDLAREFIKWMTAPEQIVHAALGSVPPLAEATSALGNTPKDEIIKMGIATISSANVEGLQMIPEYTEWGAVKGCSDAVFAAILDGTITTQTELYAMLDAQQAALEALKVN